MATTAELALAKSGRAAFDRKYPPGSAKRRRYFAEIQRKAVASRTAKAAQAEADRAELAERIADLAERVAELAELAGVAS